MVHNKAMRFPAPLIPATLVRRYKRFLADAQLADGQVVTAHCANPGAMWGLTQPGLPIWLRHHQDAKRSLPWSWEITHADGALIGSNTNLANRLVDEALAQKRLSPFVEYRSVEREVKYGRQNSRIDFLLTHGPEAPCFLEIKNVHMVRGGRHAEFPDSVTLRGRKHLEELADAKAQGARAALMFVVQRSDVDSVGPADDIDPAYGAALRAAHAAGVEIWGYRCHVALDEIRVTDPIAVRL